MSYTFHFSVSVRQTAPYKDVNVSEADGAVSDEAGVEGVKVAEALHVGDEQSGAAQEDQQDDANGAGVEPLVVVVLLLEPTAQLQKLHPCECTAPSILLVVQVLDGLLADLLLAAALVLADDDGRVRVRSVLCRVA